jgi:uroporphyrinogen-III synthase
MTHAGNLASRDRVARPFEGKRIVLTRPASQAGDFETRVRALGGEPVIAPAIAIAAPESWTIADAALRRIETYDWIAFTSVNAVRASTDRACAIGVSAERFRERRLAAVGPATAAAVAAATRTPDFASSAHTAEMLAREIPDVEDRRVLFPHGDLAGGALAAGLRQRGAVVDEVIVYRTVPGAGVAPIVAGVRDGMVDALLFASASAVRFVAEALASAAFGDDVRNLEEKLPRWPAVMCIGPLTADAARTAGFQPVVVAESATQNELVERAALWFARQRDHRGGTM